MKILIKNSFFLGLLDFEKNLPGAEENHRPNQLFLLEMKQIVKTCETL